MNKASRNSILIFIGPPGSGKGTLSYLCKERLGWVQLSTGNLCRQHIAKKTEIGKKIDFIIKSGKLIDDELIIQMVNEWLQKNLSEAKTVILDGFPRAISQAEAFDNYLRSRNDILCVNVAKIDMTDSAIMERLAGRVVCENVKCQMIYSLHKDSSLQPKNESKCDICNARLIRRSDDKEKAILERLELYRAFENRIITFYSKRGYRIKKIRGEQSIEQVYNDFLSMLDLISV